MARVFGKPGWAEVRKGVTLSLLAGFGLPTLAVGALVYGAFAEKGRAGLAALGAVWLLLVWMAWRWVAKDLGKAGHRLRDVWAYATREARVTRVLDALPGDQLVFHGLRYATTDRHAGGWNLDHVVVAPDGITVLSDGAPDAQRERRFDSNVAQLERMVRMGVPEMWSRTLVRAAWILTDASDEGGDESPDAGRARVPIERLPRWLKGVDQSGEDHAQAVVRVARLLISQYPEQDRVRYETLLSRAG